LERLIAFLLDNIFIVIIVLGFLSSLFGKSSSRKQKPSGMPTFGGGGGPARPAAPQPSELDQQRMERERLEQQRQEQQRQQALLREREAAEAQAQQLQRARLEEAQRAAETARGLEQAQRSAEARQAAAQRTVAALKAAAPSKSNQLFDPSAVHGSELRKAVVWAEVLGAPRAKKPFRR